MQQITDRCWHACCHAQVTKGASAYCAALALVTPSCRVALLREDAMAAVIFHDRPLPGRLSSAGAHSSSASGGINTPVHAGTQDAQQPGNEFGPSHAATAVVDGVEPGTPGRYGSPLPRRMASASASASVPSRSTANKVGHCAGMLLIRVCYSEG